MVDLVTRITVEAEGHRASDLVHALMSLGFAVRCERGRRVAESSVVEAQHAKAELRTRGFADREYRVFVEYARKWGFL